MTALPKVTLVTPSYNQAQYLEQTIDSVLSTGYPNLEYIIIDGASKDNSVEVIKKYEKHLAYWTSEKDGGQTYAINKGFAKATGEIYGFVNSDDLISKDTFKWVIPEFEKGATWVVGWARYFYDDGSEWPYPIGPTATAVDWLIGNPIPSQASYWTAKIHHELGGFDDNCPYAFDFEFWLRLRFKAGLTPRIIQHELGQFRLHSASKTVSQSWAYAPEDNMIAKMYLKYLSPLNRMVYHVRHRKTAAEKARLKGWAALKGKDVATARKQALARLKGAVISPASWRLLYCSLRGH